MSNTSTQIQIQTEENIGRLQRKIITIKNRSKIGFQASTFCCYTHKRTFGQQKLRVTYELLQDKLQDWLSNSNEHRKNSTIFVVLETPKGMTKNSDITGSEYYGTRDSIETRRIYLENRLHSNINQLLQFIIITEAPYSLEQLLYIQQCLLTILNTAAELTQIYHH